MQPRTSVLLGSLALFVSCTLTAQVNHATYYPKQIIYKGAPSYKAADLNAVLQLQPNKPYTTEDVGPAVQRLADTGLFADIRFTIDNLSLTLTLTPQPDQYMLPAVYSNFVMFDADLLTQLVHAKVSLFTGRIPSAGKLQQNVEDALTAVLHEKGLSDATVTSINAGATAVSFSISNPPVKVRSVHVDGVSPIADPKIAGVERAFVGNDYETGSEAAVRTRLLDTYHDLAFLDAEIALPVHGAPVIEPTRILVDLSTSAQEGSQYHLAQLVLPQTTIVSAADLAKAAGLKPGDLATRIGLLSTAAHIDREFTRRGYMAAKITPSEARDSATHTVVYSLAVDPGELFHLRTVKTVNLNEQQQKDFNANWKLVPGSAYDEGYVTSWIRQNTALRSFANLSAGYKQIAYPDTGLVDLVITFVPGASVNAR